ncbi:MAG: hypothetical protein ACM3PY_00800, partial [Omnitrophica WOR_2 bacterium]
ALTGILLLGRVWIKAALIFLTITIALFTTFFSNPGGLWTGTIGSLGYWLSQQAVARGSQPWYYFFIVFPLYEYLPFMGGIIATVYYCVKQKRLDARARQFVFFLIFWCAGIFITLTFAGEKMPWLSTHLTVPFIFLTGWLTGQLLGKKWSWVRGTHIKAGGIARAAGLSFIALFSILTIRTAYLASYVNYDYTTEYIDYAHGAPGDKWLRDDLTRIANETSPGQDISIVTDNGIAWPLAWYLRDFQHLRYYQHGKPDSSLLKAQVIIVGLEDWTKVDAILGSQYDVFQVIRIWWPLEDYRGLTWARISYAMTNPEMRLAIWQILWNRNYRLYAQLTHQTIDLPAAWPLNQPMRIYMRKDLIGEIPGGINSLELAPALVLREVNSP